MSNRIYDTLINDLRKKGKRREIYEEWEDALKQKALSFNDVSSVINRFIFVDDDVKDKALKLFGKIKPNDLDAIEEMDYEDAIEKYSIENIHTNKVSSEIKNNILKEEIFSSITNNNFDFESIRKYAKIIENKLSIREYHHLIVAGIIYEYIKYRRAKTRKL
jgi:hypothetical protein